MEHTPKNILSRAVKRTGESRTDCRAYESCTLQLQADHQKIFLSRVQKILKLKLCPYLLILPCIIRNLCILNQAAG